MNGLNDGAALSWSRLRTFGSLWALAAGLAFVMLVTLLERNAGGRAADVSLTGVSFGIVLPLLTLGINSDPPP